MNKYEKYLATHIPPRKPVYRWTSQFVESNEVFDHVPMSRHITIWERELDTALSDARKYIDGQGTAMLVLEQTLVGYSDEQI